MSRRLAFVALALALAGCGSDSASPASNDAGTSSPSCSGGADGIAVADVDLDGFPSYAIDGCSLLYVAADDGALRLRSLADGTEQVVAPASESPRRPTLAGDLIAWEADENGTSVVRVRDGSKLATLAGSFDHAGEPRATADAVVFTAWNAPGADSDTDVWVYERSDATPKLVAGGPGQQRFADISSSEIAFTDFSEDPSGIYNGDGGSLADVVVIDRQSGARTARALPGKQAFPMLGAPGVLAYLEWLEVHPIPKLQDYTIQAVPLSTLDAAGTQIAHVQSDQAVRPAARSGRVEWVVRSAGASTLWRAALDGQTPPSQVSLGNVAVIYAPSATAALTVLAVRQTSTAAPTLLGIAEP